MDYFNAFWVGGVICALVQILLDKTKLMPGRVMVLLVCSGVLLSAVNLSAIGRLCRCRCFGPPSRIWASSLERHEDSH